MFRLSTPESLRFGPALFALSGSESIKDDVVPSTAVEVITLATPPRVRLQSLVNGRVSVDAKFDEDRSLRHTFSRKGEIHDVTGFATEDEVRRAPGINAFIANGRMRLLADVSDATSNALQVTRTWAFQTDSATQYAGGFYDFASGDDDFSPAIMFGDASVGIAAHFAIILGGATVNTLTIRVSGTSVSDLGVQTLSDSEDIVIADGTLINTYRETAKKWQGQVTIEAISGTAVTANYGWVKYHDFDNQNYEVLALECLWESGSTDNTSNIVLIHHDTNNWAFVPGSTPTKSGPIADRSVDHATFTTHRAGSGAWKRTNLAQVVAGSGSEGILFCVDSGNTTPGSLSFRHMTLEVTLRLLT